jgi:hypothetical protein
MEETVAATVVETTAVDASVIPTLERGWAILNPNDLKGQQVTMVGAGGIGSHVGIMLARMGIPFTVYDGDTLELHNISNQLYPRSAIGTNKAIALKEECERFGMDIVAIPEMYVDQPMTDIVLSALDSQAARMLVWKQIREQKKTFYYIDGRMGGEIIQIFSLDPQAPKVNSNYTPILLAAPDPDPCTARAIAYNLFGCALFIGKSLQAYLKMQKFPTEINLDLNTLALLRATWGEDALADRRIKAA